MRLSKFEIEAIKDGVYTFDPQARVYLFGSRVDDRQKGGDIDLLIISEKLKPIDKIKIKAAIFKRLEEQKIDILVYPNTKRPFAKLAQARGVLL